MPEMSFLTEEPRLQWSAHLVAVMLYPDNEYKRKELITVLTAKTYLTKIQGYQVPPNVKELGSKPCGCLKWEKWSKALLDIVVILVEAPPYEKILDQPRNNKGMIAGEKLFWIAVTDNTGLDGSAAKAEHMLDKYPPIDINGKKLPCSARTIRKAWKQFMPVAHLYSAMRHYPTLYGKDRTPLENPKRLLEVSEFFRRFGEHYLPGNQGKPVLDASKTWKPPNSFRLKEIDFDLPQLSECGQGAIADYLNFLSLSKKSHQI